MTKKQAFLLYLILQTRLVKRQNLSRYLLDNNELDSLLIAPSKELSRVLSIPHDHSTQLQQLIHSKPFKRKLWQQFCSSPIINWFDQTYPESLRHIPDPPLILYYQGDLSLLNTPKLSVIGSRKPSQYAERKISYMLKPLITETWSIVSGMAKGVDSLSHQYAMDQKGNTIAILGFGFNYIYPASNRPLYEQIARNGLILSEYSPDTKPQKWHFPERNRLISGLSTATLIVEATERSGTMITADQALEQGKEVYVIPDSIFLQQAQGCHHLLNEGAVPVTTPEQLHSYLSSGSWMNENHPHPQIK
ncbi:DNA-processing protein DprA [Alkalibacillus salilacus]|uniref:DNA processing protein n=1 Tax=Alkalibacillus salilacus TaxID=284582 RepID=A0ABT9VDV0_9BACI|nr:DNA-processing protein DprA [Alkalibacillus salilacus]MDQ0159106.1 DNA processing protein [Alkalibacillus salilacus]